MRLSTTPRIGIHKKKKKKKKKKKSVGPAMKLRTPRPGAGQMSDATRVGPPYRPEPWVPWSEQCNVCFSSATFLQGRQAYTARAAAHVYSWRHHISRLYFGTRGESAETKMLSSRFY